MRVTHRATPWLVADSRDGLAGVGEEDPLGEIRREAVVAGHLVAPDPDQCAPHGLPAPPARTVPMSIQGLPKAVS